MQDERLRESTRIGFLMALLFLVVQFLLGMAVNLFVKIPTNHPGANPPEYFGGVVQSVTWALLHGPLLRCTRGLVSSSFSLRPAFLRARFARARAR